MAIKNFFLFLIIWLTLATVPVYSQSNPFGQTFQINTRLTHYVGKPSWLLIIRDLNSQQVLPFLYDFDNTDNFWLGFTFTQSFQITVSKLEFGPPNRSINNFCRLEGKVFHRKSFTVTLTGNLTPNRWTSRCHIFEYKQFPFPIVEQQPEEIVPEPTASLPEIIETAPPTAVVQETKETNVVETVTKAIGAGGAGQVAEAAAKVLEASSK